MDTLLHLKQKREEFKVIINNYLYNRKNLICLFVLIDIRHKAQFIDQEFMIKIGKQGIPFVIVFTKSDKISLSQATKNIEKYRNEMLKNWEYLPEIFITSSRKEKRIR